MTRPGGPDATERTAPPPTLDPSGAPTATDGGDLSRQERLAARDEVEEVAPGILRIQLPIMLPGLGHVNCYAFEDDRGVTLVDPGLPDPGSAAVLNSRLASIGIPLTRVHTVVVTHSHPDHFGGAGRLRVEQRCEVVAHDDFVTPFDPQPVDAELTELEVRGAPGADRTRAAADLSDLDGPFNDRLAEVLFGDGPVPDIPARSTPYGEDGYKPAPGEIEWMRSWDEASKKGLLSLRPTERVADRQWLSLGGREFQALHTPGHTGDHLCLWDPDSGVLLSGDHVLPTITPHISGLTPSEDALAEFVAALHRVAELPGVTRVLPAHGLPFDDVASRVGEIVAHHEDRLDRIGAIVRAHGDAGVRTVSRELFDERSWGPMAESETYAHLEHLRIAGHMRRSTDATGRLVYSASD
ncbi:MAG: MBL fold metallo-hydrolase [Microthrixaceae bacterium]